MAEDQYLHEIVTPTEPLSAWIYLHHEKGVTYIAPHWHQGIELSFTIAGSIDDFVINEHHYRTQSGTILVVNSQVVHSVRSVLKVADEAISIIYPYDYVNRLYPEIQNEVIDLNQPAKFNRFQKEIYIEVQTTLFKIYKSLQSQNKFSNLKLETLADQTLQLLLEYFTKPKTEYDIIYGTKEFEVARIQAITKYISEHYANKIKLADIATQVNLSKEYLAKFFKNHMELTIGSYINNVRAQKAYYDLLGGKYNLTEIAVKNGFSSIRAMNKVFQSIYGKTASNIYRNQKS
ncbi:MAG: AraC family transcriptional regulator [Liquorilactobacillus nagelii]|jgi:AraC-like DNA-binding protein|uniref:AraC family transcriptional regulator n=2 Tax=Liquorilactobacillus nagelii TaxID=82688 RepID=UPI0024316F3D|nr:AraC family transcriptional regulator [Liquorilactobacillus nagelii]MCI1634067.1 AraC family transcriptional regulator [Liquorilactobacillus nagelii]